MRPPIPLRLCLALLPAIAAAAEFPEPFDTEKGAPLPAEEAARTMELPPGFVCRVFAAEPAVRQPIAMAWDTRGRLWVAENYTYAENPSRWNPDLRDRLVILEDRDGDGRHDGRKVFWEGGAYLTSVELGYGGVWILNAGTLSFLPDRDGDDVPDGEPETILDGFDVKSIGHNIVNGLRWGPDGWLYGRHGITATSAVGVPGTPDGERVRLNCGIWRFHPRTRAFEVVCHGGTNSWGHDWNADGELFWINTVIGHLWHGIPGAHYRRMFGAHLNPHVYESIEQTADHFHWDAGAEKWSDIRSGVTSRTRELGGGHAHVGMLIYQGGLWPKEYAGAVLACNLHGNRINLDTLHREGCGYVARHGKDFMQSRDPWFRGIDLITGPDGNVFVADWSDGGECHDNDGIHRSSGRIYQIAYEGGGGSGSGAGAPPMAAAGPTGDLADLDDAALTALLHHPNNWWSRQATRVLAERGRFPAPPRTPVLADAADGDGLTRLRLASHLQRLPLEERWPIATALARRADDAADRQQPLMIWYGIEPAVAADPLRAITLIREARQPTVRRLVARRLSGMIESRPDAVDALVALAIAQEEARGDILRGLAAGLEGISAAKKPARWDEFAGAVTAAGPEAERALANDLSVVFGSGRALEDLIALARDAEAEPQVRKNALASLTRSPRPELLPVIRDLVADRDLGASARAALAAYDDPAVAVALTRAWPADRFPDQQAATLGTLVTRPSYARALLDAVARGAIPRAAVTPYHARQIAALGDAGLAKQLSAVWGDLRESTGEKRAELEKWRALLTPEALSRADPARGRAVFNAACAACHKLYGAGGALAPELTGSDRHNLNYLLENIIDPNAIVPADYRLTVFTLKDGRVLSGVVPERTDRSLVIQTPTERLTVALDRIEKQEQLPASLMPEGLLAALGEESVRHLFAYLMGTRQVGAAAP